MSGGGGGEKDGEEVVLCLCTVVCMRVCISLCRQWKKDKRGHDDECTEIITLITVMMSKERAGPDDKSMEKQPEPPIDVWLTTL